MKHVEIPSSMDWSSLQVWAASVDVTNTVLWWVSTASDAVVGLSGISQITTKAWLGVRVSALANRPPLLAAKQLVTLDHLSEGRVALGVDDEMLYQRLLAFPTEPVPLQDRYLAFPWREIRLVAS